MTSPTNAPPSPQPQNTDSDDDLDLAATRRLKQDIQQEIYRRHIIGQITKTVMPENEAQDGNTPDADNSDKDDAKASLRESGALAAWLGLTKDGDAIEAMITAQLVATHDLTMTAMGRAITRARQPGHYGTSVTDACKAAQATLRQIETLARYRTWRSKSGSNPEL